MPTCVECDKTGLFEPSLFRITNVHVFPKEIVVKLDSVNQSKDVLFSVATYVYGTEIRFQDYLI